MTAAAVARSKKQAADPHSQAVATPKAGKVDKKSKKNDDVKKKLSQALVSPSCLRCSNRL